MPVEEARDKARDRGLDLVEVGPTADPPVCRILDWGKLRYEKQKKEREAKKKTQTIEVKEVKYRPTIGQHDRDRKTDRARGFLGEGNKVKVTIFFRYRQLRRPQLGVEILDDVARQLEDVATVEHRTRGLEGRQMTMILAPIPQKSKPAEKAAAKPAAKPPAEAAETSPEKALETAAPKGEEAVPEMVSEPASEPVAEAPEPVAETPKPVAETAPDQAPAEKEAS